MRRWKSCLNLLEESRVKIDSIDEQITKDRIERILEAGFMTEDDVEFVKSILPDINRDKVKASMREIITTLEERGIQTRAIWGLINEQHPYKDADTYKIEKARYYAERILNLPCSTQITEDEIHHVVTEVKTVLMKLA